MRDSEWTRKYRYQSQVWSVPLPGLLHCRRWSRLSRPCSYDWIKNIHEGLEAGTTKVITEARESGASGICHENGDIRVDIFEQIIGSSIPIEKLIFEAPNKKMQTFFIKHAGPNANLANIALLDVISLKIQNGIEGDSI